MLEKAGSSEKRTIWMLQYISWPDTGVPKETDDFLGESIVKLLLNFLCRHDDLLLAPLSTFHLICFMAVIVMKHYLLPIALFPNFIPCNLSSIDRRWLCSTGRVDRASVS